MMPPLAPFSELHPAYRTIERPASPVVRKKTAENFPITEQLRFKQLERRAFELLATESQGENCNEQLDTLTRKTSEAFENYLCALRQHFLPNCGSYHDVLTGSPPEILDAELQHLLDGLREISDERLRALTQGFLLDTPLEIPDTDPDLINTVFILAAKYGLSDHLSPLLTKDILDKIPQSVFAQAVLSAAKYGQYSCLEMLLQSPKSKDTELLSRALGDAASNCDTKCLELLLKYSATQREGAFPSLDEAFKSAARNIHVHCLKMLLAHPNSVQIKPEYLTKVIISAVKKRQSDSCLSIVLQSPFWSKEIPGECLGELLCISASEDGNALLSTILAHKESTRIPVGFLGKALCLAATKNHFHWLQKFYIFRRNFREIPDPFLITAFKTTAKFYTTPGGKAKILPFCRALWDYCKASDMDMALFQQSGVEESILKGLAVL